MKNNKGQSLVIFVVFLPLLILLIASSIDIGLMYNETNKLNGINRLVLNYGLDNLDDDNINETLDNLIYENDKSIKEVNINISKNKIDITIKKSIKSVFSRVIGINKYDIVSKYQGILKENKKEIKRVRG